MPAGSRRRFWQHQNRPKWRRFIPALTIADIYDALTSARPYKAAYTPVEAIDIMREEANRGWRDPRVFHLFTRLHRAVLSKLGNLDSTERGLLSMRQSLMSLQRCLASESAALTQSNLQVA